MRDPLLHRRREPPLGILHQALASRALVLTAVSVALAVSDAVNLPVPTAAAKLPICTALPVAIAIPDAIDLPVPTATSSRPHRPRHPDRSHRNL
ncbi:hypothetical protein SEVIR_5G227401v4 [Setaria viridis]|uniref:Uncharacterized protein n=1 Tax=Setaria viridis TaxID=4556 RepID=A0A4U6UVR6_SETVI|nr:hypothetical protein SEVIR_5G227401v2 [Setaria viridis]